MSALDHDNADKLAASVPPWVGDPGEQNEVRRIQETVAALARRHDMARSSLEGHSPAVEQAADIGPEPAAPRSGAPTVDIEETRGTWTRTHEPVTMPPPPQDAHGRIALPSRGLVAACIAAMCMAAGIGLAVTNSLREPTLGAPVSSAADASRSFPDRVLANLTQIPPAEARARPAEPSSSSALSVFAALQNSDAAAPSPAADLASSRQLEPAQPGIASPPPAAVPEIRATASLSDDETAAMLRRGQYLIAAGDIASARLILQRVAEAGSARASFTLAGTFDPTVLSKLGVIGARPDPAKARAWYTRAAEQGSPEARDRLQQSALR
jgi:hypothetical protein